MPFILGPGTAEPQGAAAPPGTQGPRVTHSSISGSILGVSSPSQELLNSLGAARPCLTPCRPVGSWSLPSTGNKSDGQLFLQAAEGDVTTVLYSLFFWRETIHTLLHRGGSGL